jgi:transcriptional/translational regulatory protein YebC/TACO1
MSGHSKFKNIQHRKNIQDQKRAKTFSKLVKEINTAVRIGGSNQNQNPKLKNAIMAARNHNLPKKSYS